ncbi:LysM peptidoglycan-binding domain-containing protein [Salinisphaera sp. USBA-960]|uniref:LysM peptidoglycan-binding domain-containing protein n=1 Tax=Salinisphaera orenii TaxID=856731 RepID=UPI000DBEA5E5|nr:LysM peptidoglycan-binding domain-containing protein [Salifodinibacter halophilus]NNC25971.1 LysM peptidoglycan-binding domain-containing protein [Salifodinibacter halophilus]
MLNRISATNRHTEFRYTTGLLVVWLVAGCAHQQPPKRAASSAHADSSQCQAPIDNKHTSPRIGHTAQQQGEQQSTDKSGHQRQLTRNAPHRYTVKKGDTLWDLAANFLKNPQHWPQLWAQNTDIDNPNLIYPGERLVLTRTIDGRFQLRPANNQKLKPQIRTQPLASAIPALPQRAIQVFLHGDRIVASRELAGAPYIVAFADSRPAGTTGRRTYIKGLGSSEPDRYQIVRAAGSLKDPQSGHVYGTKVHNIGEVRISERGPVATGVVTDSKRTAAVSDHLLRLPTRPLGRGYQPHAPPVPVKTEIIDMSGSQPVAAQYQVVTINAGAHDCLDRGTILSAFAPGRTVTDPASGQDVVLPDHQVGRVMVFKTNTHYAFGLVLRADEVLNRGYQLRSAAQ